MPGPAPSRDDIAVIGLSCRFPGEADTAHHFWEFICNGCSAQPENPDRWKPDAFHYGEIDASLPQGGHFTKQHVAAFDANFFNLSKVEAEAMDPQRRMMMEVTYESMESAGLQVDQLAGSRTGVFMASFTSQGREIPCCDAEMAPLHTATGSCHAIISDRVSQFFDLRGPSITINTACSSSLVACHLACQSLSRGETESAIVGGSNLLLNPDIFPSPCNQQFPPGQCETFNESGEGYARGDGIGAVILKRVADAVRDGDPIRAVIRGTGCSQNGHTEEFAVPSIEGQVSLITETYGNAGLSLAETRYIEAHWTGTQAGNRREMEGISRAFSQHRTPSDKLLVGSVKANIGHLGACAGLASLIKCVYMLETGVVPPTPSVGDVLDDKMRWEDWRLKVPSTQTLWPTSGLRRISTQCFGYGTNTHLILDDAAHYLEGRNLRGHHYTRTQPQTKRLLASAIHRDAPKEQLPRVFLFRANDRGGLGRIRTSLAQHLGQLLESWPQDSGDGSVYLQDLAFTLASRRSHLQWQTYATASTLEELLKVLKHKGDAWTAPEVRLAASPARLGFIFTGQGAQWTRMGVELMVYPVFRQSVEESDHFLRKTLGCPWSAVDELARPQATSRLSEAAYSNTLCTVLQVAIVDLLDDWNVFPTRVAGHSSGEIAAAYCLGALTKQDSLRVAYYQGTLYSEMQQTHKDRKGAMMAIAASLEKVKEWLAQLTRGQVVVACINSPTSVTVSGDAAGVDELLAIVQQAGAFGRKLQMNVAYHSHHMHSVSAAFSKLLKDVAPRTARQGRTMHSSVRGGVIDAAELGASNWVRNLISPVRFSEAISSLISDEDKLAVDMLVEIGPHSTLKGPIQEILQAQGVSAVKYTSVLSRGKSAIRTALACAGELIISNVPVGITRVNVETDLQPSPLIDLPPYPWNHSTRFWAESRLSKEDRLRKHARLPLLGSPCPTMGPRETCWRDIVRLAEEPWMRDYEIQGSILYPSAGFLAMAIVAASQHANEERKVSAFRVRDIHLDAALVVTEDSTAEVILQLRPRHLGSSASDQSSWMEFTVNSSIDGGALHQNCSGLVMIEYDADTGSALDRERAFESDMVRDRYKKTYPSCQQSVDAAKFYSGLASLGLRYGPTFRNVTEIRRTGKGHCIGTVRIPAADSLVPPAYRSQQYVIHPGTLDAVFHLAFAAFEGSLLPGPMVPTTIDEVVVAADGPNSPGTLLRGVAHSSPHGFQELTSDIDMLDDQSSRVVVQIKGFRCAGVSGGSTASGAASEETRRIGFRLHLTGNAAESTNSAHQPQQVSCTIIESARPSVMAQGVAAAVAQHLQRASILTKRVHWGSDVSQLRGQPCIVLTDLQFALFKDPTPENLMALQSLVSQAGRTLWVSGPLGPDAGLIVGVARGVCNEAAGVQISTLEVTDLPISEADSYADLISRVFQYRGSDTAFRLHSEALLTSRPVEHQDGNRELGQLLGHGEKAVNATAPQETSEGLRLCVRQIGMLDSICFEPDPLALAPLEADEVEVEMKAAGVNFRDVMVALGQIPDRTFGFEGAGVVRRVHKSETRLRPGDRVVFLAPGAHRTVHRVRTVYATLMPDTMTFEEGAAILLVHTTAWYALVKTARATAGGQSILIHAAAGGVGQAVLMLARHLGLQIFATVGSEKKGKLIHEAYGVPHDHIFNSRDGSFSMGVKRMTKGRGVDIIINSLSGEALQQTWRCLAPFGTFIELGVKDILHNAGLDMKPFLQGATFTSLNLNRLHQERPDLMREALQETMTLVRSGALKPATPLTAYPASQAATAFRQIQTGQHMGKLVLTFQAGDVVPVVPVVRPGLGLDDSATYLLVGGLSGMGRSLARLLVQLGARRLCFLSRSGAKSSEARALVKELELQHQVRVLVCKGSLYDAATIARVVEQCTATLGHIRGVFQCTMVLHHGLPERMTRDQWTESTWPMTEGTWNLHEQIPSSDFFITLSSPREVLRSRGPTSSNHADACKDNLAQYRESLGIVRDVGVLGDCLRDWEAPFGTCESEFYALIRSAMIATTQHLTERSVVQIPASLATGQSAQAAGVRTPFYFDDARFSILAQTRSSATASSSAPGPDHAVAGKVSIRTQLSQAQSVAEAAAAVQAVLLERVARTLQTAVSEIDPSRPLHSYGVDSLVAVEMVKWTSKTLHAKLTVFDILSNVSIAALCEQIASMSTLVKLT